MIFARVRRTDLKYKGIQMHDLILLSLLLLISVLTVASCSIGIQCLNKNSDDKKSTNHSYLVFMLVMGIFGIIGSIGVGVYQLQKPANVPKLY
jgi:hypothetical protein